MRRCIKPIVALAASMVVSGCGGGDGGSPVEPGVATSLVKVSGDTQRGPKGSTLPNPLVVQVLDQLGRAFEGQRVTFSVIEGGGSLSATADTSDTQGRASTSLTLGSSPGTNRVQAAAEGLRGSPVVFTATAEEPTTTSVGAVNSLLFTNNQGRVTLATPNQTEEYLLIPYSLNPTTGLFSYTVGQPTTASWVDLPAGGFGPQAGLGVNELEPGLEFEAQLRVLERAVARSGARPARPPIFQPFQEPNLGDTLTLRVINSITDAFSCDTTRAVVKFKSAHQILVVDVRVTEAELPTVTVNSLGSTFENQSYPRVRGVYGAESDVNNDGKVYVEITPTVNKLTPPGTAQTSGFIGGFFANIDLFSRNQSISGRPNVCSNEREIFYVVAPDPGNRWGNVITTDQMVATANTVLPHEYMHMILYNQKVLVRGVSQVEEDWLNEGMAHVAEDVAGFPQQNRGGRTQRFLDTPNQTSLLCDRCMMLADRGAIYLFVRRLADFKGESVLGRLVNTTLIGRSNVASAAGEPFETVFRDWLATLFLSNRGLNSDPRYNYSFFNLRTTFSPMRVENLLFSNPNFSGSLKGHSGQFLQYTGATSPFHTLSLSGGAGSELNLLFIRTK